MQRFLQAVVWVSVWVFFMGLTGWLCVELASRHPVILCMTLLAAFIASIGPAYARANWRNSQYGAAYACIVVSGLAITMLLYSEMSYWFSSIEGIHAQVTDAKNIEAGKRLVAQRNREAFAKQTSSKTPEELAAAMQMELTKPIGNKTLGAHTEDCSNSGAYHYRSCAAYLSLKAQRAASIGAGNLKNEVWSARIEDTSIKRDFYAGAVALSRTFGGQVETWILAIVVTIVLLLEFGRDSALYIAFAPGRRKEAHTAAKATWDDDVAPKAETPPVAKPVADTDIKRDLIAAPEKPLVFPKPELVVKPAPAPAEPREDILPIVRSLELVVDNDEKDFPPKGRSKKKGAKKVEGQVKRWRADCCSEVEDPGVYATSDTCWSSYRAWCQAYNYEPLKRKVMVRQLGVILGRAAGKAGPRTANGSKFLRLMVWHPSSGALTATG